MWDSSTGIYNIYLDGDLKQTGMNFAKGEIIEGKIRKILYNLCRFMLKYPLHFLFEEFIL